MVNDMIIEYFYNPESKGKHIMRIDLKNNLQVLGSTKQEALKNLINEVNNLVYNLNIVHNVNLGNIKNKTTDSYEDGE